MGKFADTFSLYHPETGEYLGDFSIFESTKYVHEFVKSLDIPERKGFVIGCYWGSYFLIDWTFGTMVIPMKEAG